MLDRETASSYAECFTVLGDPTRIQIVSLLARAQRPLTVGEVTGAVDVGQSTVSHHLKALASIRFTLVEYVANASLYCLNERCVECFPTAADVVMGRRVPASASGSAWENLW